MTEEFIKGNKISLSIEQLENTVSEQGLKVIIKKINKDLTEHPDNAILQNQLDVITDILKNK